MQWPLIIFRCVLASLELRHSGQSGYCPRPSHLQISSFDKLDLLYSTPKTHKSCASALNMSLPIHFIKPISLCVGWHLPLSISNILLKKSPHKFDDKCQGQVQQYAKLIKMLVWYLHRETLSLSVSHSSFLRCHVTPSVPYELNSSSL